MQSLDSMFLTEDVVNIALMSYLDAIQDGSFFSDTALVRQYFLSTANVPDLFKDYLP